MTADDPGQAWLDGELDKHLAGLDALLTVVILPSGRGCPAPGRWAERTSGPVPLAWVEA